MNARVKRWWGWLRGKPAVTLMREAYCVELPDGQKLEIAESADCIGASCPQPQLVTLHVLEHLQPGEIMELATDNPATVETIPALALNLCSEHVVTLRSETEWRIYIRKG